MKKFIGYIDIIKAFIPLLFIVAFLSSCYKNAIPPQYNPPQTPNRDTMLTDSSIYIDITLDGNRVFKIAHIDSSWGMAWFSGDFPIDTTVIIYHLNRIGGVFDSLTNTFPGFGFSNGDINYLSYGYPQSYFLMNSAVLDSFFQEGNRSYAQLGKDTSYTIVYDSKGDTLTAFINPFSGKILTPGIQLTWYDSTGKAWKTYLGIGDQSDSYFKILKTQSVPNANTPGFSNYAIITAEFECNLYDGKGNVIHLTYGRFRLWAIV